MSETTTPAAATVPDEEKGVGGRGGGTAREALAEPQRTISNVDAPVPDLGSHGDFHPPDGGWRAWSQVLAALMVNSIVWGYPTSFGVFQLYYVEELRIPSSQVSWIGSIQIFLSFGMCTVSGRLADAGLARQTVAAGTSMVVLGTFMTSLATKYWQIFLAQGVCTGMGAGITFMPAVAVASSYFDKNRAFALSVSAVGTSVGSLILPSIVQYLIPQVGFAWAVRCEGFVALVICVIATLLLKPYLPPRKSGPLVEWDAFRELPYMLFAFGGFLNLYTLFFGFFYVSRWSRVPPARVVLVVLTGPSQINSFAREVIGFTPVDAVSILLITNALGIPARPIAGYIADNIVGPINVYMVSLLLLGASIYAWIGVTTRVDMYIFSAFYGFIVGATQGTYVGALASLTKDPTKMGTRFGMVSTMTAFAVLAGPPTAGAIIERSGGSYRWAQVWGGTVAVCGAVSVVASRLVTTGLKLKAKV